MKAILVLLVGLLSATVSQAANQYLRCNGEGWQQFITASVGYQGALDNVALMDGMSNAKLTCIGSVKDATAKCVGFWGVTDSNIVAGLFQKNGSQIVFTYKAVSGFGGDNPVPWTCQILNP